MKQYKDKYPITMMARLLKVIEKCVFKGSMSKRGDCFDNAPIESFWGYTQK